MSMSAPQLATGRRGPALHIGVLFLFNYAIKE